nr:PAS domain S-box protein [Thiocapsa sp.]
MANGLAESFARLAASDASLREAQAIAHLGSWDFDYVSGRLAWDVETFRLLGYAPDAVTPSLEAFYAVVPEEDAARVRAEMEAVLTRPDGLFAVEHRVLGSDGVLRILREEGRVHFAADGVPLRLAGTCLDITAQRAVEDALRAQEERYRLVVENIADLVVRTDAHGRFAYVSPSYCRLFGRDEAELIGHHFMPRVHPDDREHTAEAMRALQNPPYTCRIEQRAETARGWRWLQWVDRAVLDAEGRVDAIVGIGRDITERKAAESALAEERRRLADIIAGTQVGTWEWDLVTNALTVNPRWAEMIGRRLEDLEPTTIETWRMFCHPEDLARSESAVARHLGGETDQYRCELRMLHDDGRWIWVQDQGRVSARDAHGRPLRMAGIHEDITVRQEAEIELMRRESLERELLGLASDFVAVYDEELDPLINRTLERLGGLTRSDRAYVFRFDRVADTMSNSHEWVAPGIEPMIGHLQQMPIEHFSASMQLLESGQAAVVPRVAELPDAWAGERETLQFQAILSLVLVPLLQDERLIGFVGFDAVQAPRDWSEAEVRFLRVFASILVSAFERARIYSELRDSNRRYDQLAVQSRIVSWEVDAEGLYTYLSPAVEVVWGYRREALVDRKHFFDLVPELLRDSVKAEVMPGFARLDHFTDLVNPIRCADGSTIWVLSNAVPVVAEDGTLLGYRGTDVDITERYRAQEQLAQSEARLSAVVENAPIGIAIADPDGRVHLANRALGEFLGYAPQDLLGMHFDEFTCPDDVTTELALFRELAAGQRNLYRMTKRYRKADGAMAWGDLRVVLLPGRAEDRPMALGMVEDITEFQAATERKRELRGGAAALHQEPGIAGRSRQPGLAGERGASRPPAVGVRGAGHGCRRHRSDRSGPDLSRGRPLSARRWIASRVCPRGLRRAGRGRAGARYPAHLGRLAAARRGSAGRLRLLCAHGVAVDRTRRSGQCPGDQVLGTRRLSRAVGSGPRTGSADRSAHRRFALRRATSGRTDRREGARDHRSSRERRGARLQQPARGDRRQPLLSRSHPERRAGRPRGGTGHRRDPECARSSEGRHLGHALAQSRRRHRAGERGAREDDSRAGDDPETAPPGQDQPRAGSRARTRGHEQFRVPPGRVAEPRPERARCDARWRGSADRRTDRRVGCPRPAGGRSTRSGRVRPDPRCRHRLRDGRRGPRRGSSSRCSRPRPNNAGMGSACSWCRSSSCAPVRVWPSPRRSVGAPSFVS